MASDVLVIEWSNYLFYLLVSPNALINDDAMTYVSGGVTDL